MQVLRRAYITPARRSLHELYVCAFLVVSVRALSPRAVPCCLRVLTAYSFMSGDARRMFCGKIHAQRRVYRACIMAAVRLENVRDLPDQSPRARGRRRGAHLPRVTSPPTSNKNDGNAHRGVHSDQVREADPERVLRLRTVAATGLIGAAQIDLLLVLRTIGMHRRRRPDPGETSADSVRPTEAHVQLAHDMLDDQSRRCTELPF